MRVGESSWRGGDEDLERRPIKGQRSGAWTVPQVVGGSLRGHAPKRRL